MTRCYDITGVVRAGRDDLDRTAAALATGCDDADRFGIRVGASTHLLAPRAAEALLADWAAAPAPERLTTATACALGTAEQQWIEDAFDQHVLVAPLDDLEALRWWRAISTSPHARAGAVYHAGARPAPDGQPQPAIGIDTYLALLATLPVVVCVGATAHDELIAITRRPAGGGLRVADRPEDVLGSFDAAFEGAL